MLEVRGRARIEEHFQELVKKLRVFDFDVNEKAQTLNVRDKYEDGTPIPL